MLKIKLQKKTGHEEDTILHPHISVPVGIILELFNALPKNNKKVREKTIEFIKTYKEKYGSKEHVVEGFYLTDAGSLEYDNDLYDEAICRGKIDTRTKTVQEALNELKSEIELLGYMGDEQSNSLNLIDKELISKKICQGQPISEESKELLSRIMNPKGFAISEPKRLPRLRRKKKDKP